MTSDEPLLRVINPDATPEEVAALVAVFTALVAAQQTPPPTATPRWRANHRKLRSAPLHGPGGWRSSGLPR